MPTPGSFLINSLRGGLNEYDPDVALSNDQCVVAENCEFFASLLGEKRQGTDLVNLDTATAWTNTLNTVVPFLFRHIPVADEEAAELWALSCAADNSQQYGLARKTTVWQTISPVDDIDVTSPAKRYGLRAASLHGKMFIGYRSGAVNSPTFFSSPTSGTNYVVPAGVTTITVKCWGAAGGADGGTGAKAGGPGGYAQADIATTPGETLTVKVGGGGARDANAFQGGAGGGYTALLRGSTVLIVAGAGGGAAQGGAGGPGGASTGSDGSGIAAGKGGTIAAGGAFGGMIATPTINWAMVAGAGGGGSGLSGDNNSEGGGGAGGDVASGSDSVTPGSTLPVVIGGGGAGSSASGVNGTTGSDSTFNGHTVKGGGGGASQGNNGSSGGSGGGAASISSNPASAGTGTNVHDGGAGLFNNGGDHGSGGGGGAGGVGGNATLGANVAPGAGGPGLTLSVPGISTVFGAGGPGAASRDGSFTGANGTANTGTGGGGGSQGGNGGNGGSGICYVWYLTGTVIATGGTITTSGGYTIHTFTANDNFVIGTAATAGASLAGGNGGGWNVGGDAGAAGGTNGGGTGGGHGVAATVFSGGGGGAGYFGGGGGGAGLNNVAGGGGGGSSFTSGSNQSTAAGSGTTPGNNTDVDYTGNAGVSSAGAAGNPGLLVIRATAAQDRLHVWDGTSLRRSGLATPNAPSVVDTAGGGTFNGLRYVRQRYTVQDANSGVTLRRSEPSAATTFTPNGAKDGMVITKAASISESETHWEVEISLNNGDWYRVATQPVGTTTYTDKTAFGVGYNQGTNVLSESVGNYQTFWSAKMVIADDDRIVVLGAWENTAYGSSVGWSVVTADPGVGNDERIPIAITSDSTNRVDLDPLDGGDLTASARAQAGLIYTFKMERVWSLTRTGVIAKAYDQRCESKTYGALPDSAVNAVTETGIPCVYFLDPRVGPCRIVNGQIQRCGLDINNTWKTVNIDADLPCRCVYYPDKLQVRFWVATGTSNTPNKLLVLQTNHMRTDQTGQVRGGWSVWSTGRSLYAYAVCLFSTNVNSNTFRTRVLVPFVGLDTSSGITTPDRNMIQRYDDATSTDSGQPYNTLITSKPFVMGDLLNQVGVMAGAVLATASSGVGFDVQVIQDFGLDSNTKHVDCSPVKSESQVIVQIDDLTKSEVYVLQVSFGDINSTSGLWQINGFSAKVQEEAPA